MTEPLNPMSRIPLKQKTSIGGWLIGSICFDQTKPVAEAVAFTIELENQNISAIFDSPELVDEAISLLIRHRNHVWPQHKPNIQS